MNSLNSGTRVEIHGLESEEGKKLNGTQGTISHFSKERGRYAVNCDTSGDSCMIKESNLKAIDNIFEGEDAMLEELKRMGMPEKMIENLTPSQKKTMFEMTKRQDIVDKARNAVGEVASEEGATREMTTSSDGSYTWRDNKEAVYLEIKTTHKKEDVQCKIEPGSICISTNDNNEILLEGNLFQKVLVNECQWKWNEGGKLCLTLQKATPMRWLQVVR
mmetsp:Transcript_9443/g.13824  ORF Transcript_9443/g.13824 Transcript_9443/m.13824 type:complete len:218 (+) Transcript_9443:132-785(+)|eukprot:CAMPEP_0194234986 /NCGR_PEP_ID=MMETSP0158-20130606/2598_1 /TAXON_ID=33649 /ORGANISM="Thalassionema nitzschioides, Strain L26-B" /LENGTH=217 /DNA_ID=CAMNT_0038968325 /DNA_START=59 /DNA_END=712 /DNA_ORIENTATION=-